MFSPCIVIPVYRHARQFQKFAEMLPKLPLIIIDDGNGADDRAILQKTANEFNAVLVTLKENQGKCAAVMEGFREAERRGYSHALQIDADGQHDHNDIAKFLKISQDNPSAIVNGCPVYDATAPKSRRYGRRITNFWVAVEVGRNKIKDAMCGFRVYPLREMMPLLYKGMIFKRMGGDIEMLVKACWQGIAIINTETRVHYPEGGVSNFRMFQDNVKISLLHTMLVLGMVKHRISRMFRQWK